jgi:hypothetical protein
MIFGNGAKARRRKTAAGVLAAGAAAALAVAGCSSSSSSSGSSGAVASSGSLSGQALSVYTQAPYGTQLNQYKGVPQLHRQPVP